MKQYIFLLLLGSTLLTYGQSTDTLILSNIHDPEWIKTYSHGTNFKIIKFPDGSTLPVGGKMIIGRPSSNNQKLNKNSSSPQSVNTFSYIILGRAASTILTGPSYLSETYKGKEVVIEDIKFFKNGKRSGAGIIFDNPGMDITVWNLEDAMKYGELINPKAAMTSDQALAELQKAKAKLDLDVITKEEYDSIKIQLMKVIK